MPPGMPFIGLHSTCLPVSLPRQVGTDCTSHESGVHKSRNEKKTIKIAITPKKKLDKRVKEDQERRKSLVSRSPECLNKYWPSPGANNTRVDWSRDWDWNWVWSACPLCENVSVIRIKKPVALKVKHSAKSAKQIRELKWKCYFNFEFLFHSSVISRVEVRGYQG